MTTEIHIHLNKQPPVMSSLNTNKSFSIDELNAFRKSSNLEMESRGDMELNLECSDDMAYIIPQTEPNHLDCTSLIAENIQMRITFPNDCSHVKTNPCTVKKKDDEYQCYLCGCEFTMETKYVSHMLLKHGTSRPFKCPFCDYVTNRKKLILKHLARKHKDLKLTNCRQICISNESLLNAKKREDLEWKCEECNKKFTQKRNFNDHMLRHKNQLNYHCEKCPKSFVSSLALKRHSVTHAKERPFICEVKNCGKNFKRKVALTDHWKTVHSSSKKMTDIIDSNKVKACTGASGTEMEVCSKKDNKELKYACSWKNCEKRFRDRFNMSIHYASHTGDRNRKCQLCDYNCIQKASLNYHIRKHHSEKCPN